jgi:trehalose-phosphatase
VLIASDFDGTLAPIVPRPDAAAPLPGALDLLTRLAAHPRLRVALVSGRALADLQARCPVPGAWYVGGHGNESSGPETHAPVHEPGHHMRIRRQLEPVAAELRRRAAAWPGTQVEAKPYSLAIHYRQAPQWAAAVEQAASELALSGDFRVMLGRQMAELLPAEGLTKGQAVHRLRARLGCDLAFYFGDDVTDEDVFRFHDAQIIGVKVAHREGGRATAAAFRLASPRDVLRALAAIEQAFPSIQEKSLRFSAVQP